MNTTIELSSGKIINLNRFVALVPDEKTENQEYHLILEGYEKAIALDSQEAAIVGFSVFNSHFRQNRFPGSIAKIMVIYRISFTRSKNMKVYY